MFIRHSAVAGRLRSGCTNLS